MNNSKAVLHALIELGIEQRSVDLNELLAFFLHLPVLSDYGQARRRYSLEELEEEQIETVLPKCLMLRDQLDVVRSIIRGGADLCHPCMWPLMKIRFEQNRILGSYWRTHGWLGFNPARWLHIRKRGKKEKKALTAIRDYFCALMEIFTRRGAPLPPDELSSFDEIVPGLIIARIRTVAAQRQVVVCQWLVQGGCRLTWRGLLCSLREACGKRLHSTNYSIRWSVFCW